MALIGDFLKSVVQLTDRRFLAVLLGALAITLALLIAIAFGASLFVGFLPETLSLPWIGEIALPLRSLGTLAFGAVFWASSFLMFPVAALFVGLWLERIADAVEARHYPDRRASRAPGMLEAIKLAIGFALVVIGVNLVALIPLLIGMLFFGPLALAVPILVNGYLLSREYFQLVAERHIPSDEAGRLRRRHRLRIWFAGCLMAAPLMIPALNLLIPVLGVATITHQFHRLRARAAPA